MGRLLPETLEGEYIKTEKKKKMKQYSKTSVYPCIRCSQTSICPIITQDITNAIAQGRHCPEIYILTIIPRIQQLSHIFSNLNTVSFQSIL